MKTWDAVYQMWKTDDGQIHSQHMGLLIRCKDCKHWQYESCFVESEEGDADSIILDRFAFDFCSRAERKEENETL